MGRVRHRPGRDDPRHRHRTVRGAGHGRERDLGDRRQHRIRPGAVPVPGRAGLHVAGPDRRHPQLRERQLRAACRQDGGQAHRRPVRLVVLARLVPGGADQHDPHRRLPVEPVRHTAGRHHPPVRPVRRADLDHGAADQLRRPACGLHPVLLRRAARRRFRHRARNLVHGPADGPGDTAAVQNRQLPLVQHRRLPHPGRRARELHVHHRLDVPDHLERDRDGGGRLLRRRVPQRPARRQDRADRRGRLRHAHLHPDPAGLRRRARRGAVHLRPAHPLHRLHQRAVRPRLLDQVVHRRCRWFSRCCCRC